MFLLEQFKVLIFMQNNYSEKLFGTESLSFWTFSNLHQEKNHASENENPRHHDAKSSMVKPGVVLQTLVFAESSKAF